MNFFFGKNVRTFSKIFIFIFQIDFPKIFFRNFIDLEKYFRDRKFFEKKIFGKSIWKMKISKFRKSSEIFFEKSSDFFFKIIFRHEKLIFFFQKKFSYKVWTVTIDSARLHSYTMPMGGWFQRKPPKPADFGVTGIFSRTASY